MTPGLSPTVIRRGANAACREGAGQRSRSPNKLDWAEAIEIVVARTRHERLRWLCSDANPDVAQRDGYRRLMIELAEGETDAQRAVRLIAENPPPSLEFGPRRGCCG